MKFGGYLCTERAFYRGKISGNLDVVSLPVGQCRQFERAAVVIARYFLQGAASAFVHGYDIRKGSITPDLVLLAGGQVSGREPVPSIRPGQLIEGRERGGSEGVDVAAVGTGGVDHQVHGVGAVVVVRPGKVAGYLLDFYTKIAARYTKTFIEAADPDEILFPGLYREIGGFSRKTVFIVVVANFGYGTDAGTGENADHIIKGSLCGQFCYS